MWWGPTTLLPLFAYSFVRNRPREDLTKGYSRLCGAENTREKRALRRAGIRNSLPGGEIDAIAIVIERDIISIIIIIISTIYTAITTAAPRISMNEVRKKLFTISLSGKAAHWYKLLKNGDSIDWEDIVPLFYSKFYPPSEIHKDRNRIYNFWPHDGESIAQAWGRLKSLMLKCPIHELPGNVIIDNFYARLSFQDKTLLDTSCSGSFTRKNEEFKRDLLDRIQENTEGWENDKDRESEKLFLQLVLFEMWKFYVQHLENSESEAFRKERDELEEIFLRQPILKHDLPVEDLGTTPPPKEDPVFDLKPLPDNLKYAHIDDKKIYPVIISSKLSEIEEERLLEILKKHRGAIGYTLDDLKGISPSICQHAINMEEDAKPVVEHQRRLIPKMKEVVRNEVLKLLEAGIIYPIADSRWVSPVHCVPKKGGMTVVPNDNDELIPQRIVVGLENIAYDPVPVNDSFPNEQLAVIKGALPPALDLDSFPCVEEAIRVADEFCDQYRALRREVEILQEENQRLRRMLEYYSNPSTRPSPPHSGNNESLQVLVQNCKIEKLKLKEILMKRERNSSPPSPKE
ncbi:hypothetical protein QYE76_071930 [Lolium multiflorum]|uniref:Retrotransposon gag domain-containing protein n=1 Tax=Lolium multiflorum TaxID=4521 RepID=A0AAD8VBP4_LOLMU|nr:hypothetical protein QYE76_071930 [Lolium multiflorum]